MESIPRAACVDTDGLSVKQLRFCLLIPAILVCGTTAISPTRAQELTPLDEGAAQPLSTPAISESDVELFGKLAHLWTLPDATEVIQFYGEFALHVGPRRITSRDAVVWMTADQYEGRPFQRFDVFAWQDARVVEPGGSVTSGPVLLVTLQSFGSVSVSFDARTDESSAESPLYQRADRVRRKLSPFRKPLYARETPLEVQQLAAEDGQPVGTNVRPPTMIRPGKKMTSLVHDGRRLLVAGGGVYIARGAASSEEFLEIRARDAVFFARESALQDQIRLGLEGRDPPSQSELERALQQDEPDLVREIPDSPQGVELGAVSDILSAVYLEGDVILSRGRRTIRASRLFYDFDNERALILDAVMFAPVPSRNVPIYVRADEVRQLSSREYVARHALISTSEFHTPHYAVGADKVFLQDRTLGPPDAQVSGLIAGTH